MSSIELVILGIVLEKPQSAYDGAVRSCDKMIF